MARFLFVVPPLTGHVNPTAAVAHHLAEAGHEVAWVGYPSRIARLLPAGARLIALPDDDYAALEQGFAEETRRVKGLGSLVFLWERFLVPLTHLMLPGVDRAVDAFAPDLLVVDQQALAGAFVARRRGLRWATIATSAADALDPTEAGAKMVWDFIEGQLAALQDALGTAAVARPDNSPDLVLVFSTRALFGERDYGPAYRFVGPSLGARPAVVGFPWDALADTRRVLVSLGTVSPERGRRFFGVVTEALADAPLQVVLVAPPDQVDRVPDNFIVRDYVPQLELLPQMHAVVSHAGHNTVAESLAHGLPLVLTPIRDDQPIVAKLVADAGAGIRLAFGRRLRPAQLREAVDRVLAEPQFREAAARLRASFEAAGGAARAAELLVELQGR